MAEISAGAVKELRERTGSGMMDCKKALAETNGDVEKAIDYLREKGLAKAAKKASRTASDGRIFHYVHNNFKVGALVELNSETDFVAKTDEFNELGHEIAMHITHPALDIAKPIGTAIRASRAGTVNVVQNNPNVSSSFCYTR